MNKLTFRRLTLILTVAIFNLLSSFVFFFINPLQKLHLELTFKQN